ncbi:hypothetical protein GL325_02225 [Aeromicrobium sp. 636]|uniref:SCP domain-containing protein n=1 Tax=Aeromicrobium senzhongii TaxID=2663859 RepID=A0A8I0ETI6_9ACTN|nr:MULTISPECIES: CAP domain-containing protein [Aeromicrobium]MBC9225131.1 hypothetical protein [Aeromicrobium senzhongii]MCQ3997241.1 hypothetical protein [Aeromicrobium sp. 636]MTB87173.1 hypothetical protein [Aeromicrobium senzhongii]QNL95749.1 hypothetical protein H9L21_07580 [Aeromicrobium senzhongii]
MTAVVAALAAFMVALAPGAAEARTKPKVELSFHIAKVTLGSQSMFAGRVGSKKAIGAKVALQRKTAKGWRTVKTTKVDRWSRYSATVRVTARKSTYRVKLHATKKVRTAYSRRVIVRAAKARTEGEKARAIIERDVNAYRKKHGRGPIALIPSLNRSAQLWVRDLAVAAPDPQPHDYIPDGVTLRAAHESAESGARGRIAAWRADRPTRRALLTGNALFGAGYVASRDWISFVAVTPWYEEPYGG